MKYKTFFLVLSILISLSTYTNAQDNSNFQIQDVTESIGLTTDRDLYFSGETIVFTANYFINNEVPKTKISNVIYAELISCYDNEAISQKKYKVLENNISGTIEIPTDVATGLYMFRMYTKYQRNFSSYHYSYNFISIINPDNNSQPIEFKEESDQISIAAEGNKLVENVNNNIAIHIPKHILKTATTLSIVDNQANAIIKIEDLSSEFISIKDFKPLASIEYKLQLLKSNGDTLIKAMPKVVKSGIKTSIQLSANNLLLKIHSQKLFKNSPKVNVTVYSFDYKSNYNSDIILTDSEVVEIIPSDNLSYGINHIVLSDKDGNIKSINSYYKSKIQNNIEINIVKENFNTREEVLAEISTKGNTKDLSYTSISVCKQGAKKEDYGFFGSVYLKNPLLLQNYLQNNTEYSDEELKQIMILYDSKVDNTLLKKEIISINSTTLKYIPEIRDLTISGVLINKETREPISNHNIYLSVLFENPQIHLYKTRENGEFIFSLNNIYGKNDIYLCAENNNENNYEILIKSSFSNNIPEIGPTPMFINDQHKELIEDIYINSQVERRVPQNKLNNTKEVTKLKVFNIDEDHKKTTILSNYVQLKNVEELFFELVPNAKINTIKDQYSFTVLNEKGFALAGTPLVIIDHIPVFDPLKVIGLDIDKIEKVDIIYKTYYLGSNTFHGVIIISTKKGDFGNIEFAQSGTFLKYETLAKEENDIMSSKNPNSLSKTSPNLKTSLYWNSKFKLTNEKKSIRFYSSDNKGVYNIVVKAYSPDGQIYYGKKQINIK
ncbi:MAG: hypothetical protein JEY96_13465 [Bacteroidales bacterium]|nr:hypothetical protein [Bacteroidales bacterium]